MRFGGAIFLLLDLGFYLFKVVSFCLRILTMGFFTTIKPTIWGICCVFFPNHQLKQIQVDKLYLRMII